MKALIEHVSLQTLEAARAYWMQQTPDACASTEPTVELPDLEDDDFFSWGWHSRFVSCTGWSATINDVDRVCGPLYRMHMERL